MKYKVSQYKKHVEPTIYTEAYVSIGRPIQILEKIKESEVLEWEIESNLHYCIGEQLTVDDEYAYVIEHVIKPIDDSNYIKLILEDKINYCEDYHKIAGKMITEFKLNNMQNVNEQFKSNDNWFKRLFK